MHDALPLQPELVWDYFFALSRIPRPSGHEAAAMAWVVAQAKAHGLAVEQDEVGNVLLRKAATPGREAAPTTVLQAHIDMVCEKNETTRHDFLKDPIRVRRDGEYVRATGTTLGADDGIGVAAGLAAMTAKDLVHGPLELLVTIDEETGLTGANALRPGWLRGKFLLNLDSEEEGFVTIGCAGGVDTVATRTMRWEPAPAVGEKRRLKIAGLKGGHSGVDIHLGRANAIRVLGQVLDELGDRVRIGEVRGGNKRNALPREASAQLVVAPEHLAAVEAVVQAAQTTWASAYGSFEPSLTLTLEPGTADRVMVDADAGALVRLLLTLPHGVEAMSAAIPDLVQTSTNLGVLQTQGDAVEVCLLTRSAIESSKAALTRRIAAACTASGFAAELVGGYPGWKPEPGASLVHLVDEVWQARTGRALKVIAIHAGLECGIIGEKYPGMEMVSFGPDVFDAHTPDERVRIASVARFWELLTGTLSRIARS